MDLRQLKHFIEVAKVGKFTKAAENLHVSQPGLSLSIQRLEHEVGGRLLARSTAGDGRGATLTPLGETFLADVEPLVHGLDAALASAQRRAASILPKLMLGFVSSTPREVLNRALVAAREPGTADVTPVHMAWRQESALFRRGAVDIALVTARAGRSFQSFVSHQIATYPLCAVIPEDHPFADRSTITVADLRTMQILDPGALDDEFFERAFWLCDGALEDRIAARPATSVEEMTSFISSGYGASVVSSSLELQWETLGLKRLIISDCPPAGIFLVRRRSEGSSVVAQCWRAVRSTFNS
ncbi:LysR family transcriptional regulator [Kribbella turkmenica]|uniref:LysR family transcriptional regulator n=1 Tax=Kribbella turkmenica TaxID=2530375 RepID=A0A4R4XFK1_9ACTN|nr:LysR family transcriptional regulator [Kribbella turkmenica]TDD29222.1 LysR family transcriptional regulator [Kribbella turkmenica]